MTYLMICVPLRDTILYMVSEMDRSRNLQGDNWRKWKQRFELYMGKNKKTDEVQTATLLHPYALEVFNTFSFATPGDDKKLDEVLEKIIAYQRHLG